MTLSAAFRWDIGKKEVTYMVYDVANLKRRIAMTKIPVANKADAFAAVVRFQQEVNDLNASGKIEYLILNANAPWQTHRNPNPLSQYILETFENAVPSLTGWTRSNQVKRELRKPELEKFKEGLRNLSLLSSKPQAHEWHLWSVLLHATKASHKKELKKLWQAVKQVSAQTKAGKLQFQAWYGQL